MKRGGWPRLFAVTAVLALCACGGPEVPEYEGRTLEEWVRRASGPAVGPAHTVDEQRSSAMATLERIGPPAVPALGEMVMNPNADLSLRAVQALKKIGPEAEPAVPDLIEGLRRHERGQVRRAIPGALAVIAPNREDVQLALIGKLRDPDEGMFTAALAALRMGFQAQGPASEKVGRRLGALRGAGLNETRERMIRGLPGAGNFGWGE